MNVLNNLQKRIHELKDIYNYKTVHAHINAVKIIEVLEGSIEAMSIADWNEDIRDCLWRNFPIEVSPYCGSPMYIDFPKYKTDFQTTIHKVYNIFRFY